MHQPTFIKTCSVLQHQFNIVNRMHASPILYLLCIYVHSSNYVKIRDEMSKQKSVNTLHVYLGIKQSMCTLDIE